MSNILSVSSAACTACGACVNICPVRAVKFLADSRGFNYPSVNNSACTDCGLCLKVCSVGKKQQLENKTLEPKVYAAYHNDEEIRRNSSSGGIFSVLAQYILTNNGIVYGAAFDENFKVVHIGIRTVNDLEKLRGSKYVQSHIPDGLFEEIRKELNAGTHILFSGTPCQVAGLKLFLQKEYKNLLSADLVCHGVPSPKIFKDYLCWLEDLYCEKVTSFSFRDKKYSWEFYNIKACFKKRKYERLSNADPYMRLFLSHPPLCLRDSCYQCQFADTKRVADITIADFWGLQYAPDTVQDDKGVSCVICNTIQGYQIWEKVRGQCKVEERQLQEAIAGNLHLKHPVPKNVEAIKAFWSRYEQMGFAVTLNMQRTSIRRKLVFVLCRYFPGVFCWLVKFKRGRKQ